jgi:HD domain
MADVLIDGSPARTQERAAGPRMDPDAPAGVVNDYIAPAPGRHLPHMLLATTLVAVLPLVVSLALRASGLVSGWMSVGLAVIMSLGSSTAGSAYWRKRGRHSEVLFGELLLWGWIRSWRQERELANATRLLDLVNTGAAQHDHASELTVEQREHLLQQLAGALEGQDVYLNGHSRRVARHATMIARGMGLSSDEVARIRAAAAVHDVGKLRTPKAILNKPGRLTDEEFEVIKRHPVDGAAMVAALGHPELTRIVRHHHERLDGAGYPDRLRGEEIPLGARIIAVADTFDAITSARPYRDAAPHQKAIDILRAEAGTQLDPDAVRQFLAYYSGSRPTVVWAIITSALRRFVSWLTGDPAAAATISASKVAAAATAAAAIGAAAAAAPVPVPVPVLHHPHRPVVAHVHAHVQGGAARTPRATSALRRDGASVVVPGAAPGSARRRAAKATSANVHRRAAHGPVVNRRRARPGAGKHASNRTAGAATGSPTAASALTSTGTGQSAAGPSASSAAPATPRSTQPAPITPSVAPTTTPSPTTPSQESPATQSQGSNGNGNAYGHTKLLGNGHGNGLAKGHGNSTPTPSVSTPTIPTPSIPTPGPSSSSTEGSDGGSSHGNGHGQGDGSDNRQGNGGPPPIPTTTPSTAGNQGNQGDGKGHGSGDGHGHGHG